MLGSIARSSPKAGLGGWGWRTRFKIAFCKLLGRLLAIEHVILETSQQLEVTNSKEEDFPRYLIWFQQCGAFPVPRVPPRVMLRIPVRCQSAASLLLTSYPSLSDHLSSFSGNSCFPFCFFPLLHAALPAPLKLSSKNEHPHRDGV